MRCSRAPPRRRSLPWPCRRRRPCARSGLFSALNAAFSAKGAGADAGVAVTVGTSLRKRKADDATVSVQLELTATAVALTDEEEGFVINEKASSPIVAMC